MTNCKCIDCKYCFKWCTGKQTQISCKNNSNSIYEYWKEHKIQKAVGFIGYMTRNVFPIKRTPKWCPLASQNKE